MTDKVQRAYEFSLRVHSSQKRKDGKPYILHPYSVANLLFRNGADEDLICAGFLHDTIEDGKVTEDELKEKFGEEVLRIVLFDTENKSLPWLERKQNTLNALKECDRKCAMLVCADKLANLIDIHRDLKEMGEKVWDNFKYGRKEQEWLYRSFLEVLRPLSDLKMYFELTELVDTVFGKGEFHANDNRK